MAKGYYEHEIKIRFNEGLLNKSHDWQWFVEETETDFDDPFMKIETFSDFINEFVDVSSVYKCFSVIADARLGDDLVFSSEWLKVLWEACQIRSGQSEMPDMPTGNTFFDLLDVLSLSTRMLNAAGGRNLLWDYDFFTLGNYQELYDLSGVADIGSVILNWLERIDISDRDQCINTVRRNLECVHVSCNQDAARRMLDEYFDADFLSYRKPDSDWCGTWQEVYLVQCFRTSMRDGKLENYITFRDSTGEELAFLTEDALKNMRQNLDDPRAHCVIDSVTYLLYSEPMQNESVELLIEQALGRISNVLFDDRDVYKLNCTAIYLSSKLLNERQLSRQNKSKLLAGVSKALKDSTNTDVFQFLSVKGFPLNSEQKHLIRVAKGSKSLAIDGIDSSTDLLSYLDDADIQRYCDRHSAEKTIEKLYNILPEAGAILPTLLVSAMNYLIGLLDNEKVDSDWTKHCLMELQKSWGKQYYSATLRGMQTSSKDVSLTHEQVAGLKEEILEYPDHFAHFAMPLSEDGIEDVLERYVDVSPVVLASKTMVTSYAPYNEHYTCSTNERSIDAMLFKEVDTVNNKFSYKQRNHFETEKIMGCYYENANFSTRLMMGLVRQVSPEMYKTIRSEVAGRYTLLEYPSDELTIGHTCQLFPVIENTIRKLGAYCGVVPFRLKKNEFHMLKDACQVLYGILDYVRNITDTIAGAEDIAFVYHVMFSTNGLNVRNACIHGQDYQSGPRLKEAFVLTVLCEYMLLYKLDLLKGAQVKLGDTHNKQASVESGEGK